MIEPVPDYYRLNFITLLNTVQELYEDLLTDEELAFIDTFHALSEAAQCLYVRLVSRTGPIFRSDKVQYVEIPDIETAAAELEGAGFMVVDGEYTMEELLPLLRRAELAAAAEANRLTEIPPGKLKRTQLVEIFLELEDDKLVSSAAGELFTTYEPSGTEILAVLKLLFFGNFRQDFSEFIITHLGIVTYEKYPLEKSARAFSERRSINNRIILHNAAVDIYERLPDLSRDEIVEFASALSDTLQNPHDVDQISRRFERLNLTLARQLERLDHPRDALELYKKTSLPPSREREARIRFLLGDHDLSEKLCLEMIANPICEEELEFGSFFIRRTVKKTGSPPPPRIDFKIDYQDRKIEKPISGPVEAYALDLFTAAGYTGFYTENQLWNALFALAFWDIIFLPIEGVFYNRYQRAPADLYTEQFRNRRKTEIESRMREIEQKKKTGKTILNRYDEKKDIACSLINWKLITREQISAILERIPAAHLSAIFRRMVRDLRANTNGFPDLVLFPPSGRRKGKSRSVFRDGDQGVPYLLVEVKGPGDQVQKNQKRWMKYFCEAGIPNRVFRMNLVTDPE